MPMSAQRRVAVAERHTQAVQLAASGLSYDVIAQRLGYTHRSAARKAVVGALQARTVEAVDELRELEVQRLDGLQRALWERALGGEQRAVDSVVRIITARVKLLGLDQSDAGPSNVRDRVVVDPADLCAYVARPSDTRD